MGNVVYFHLNYIFNVINYVDVCTVTILHICLKQSHYQYLFKANMHNKSVMHVIHFFLGHQIRNKLEL